MPLAQTIERYRAEPGLTVWWLGGPSTALRSPEALIYLDLFTGPSPIAELHKASADVLDPLSVRRADAVLCTHHDLDHCHAESLRPLYAQTEAVFIGPVSCVKLFREWGFAEDRIVTVAVGQQVVVNDLQVTALLCNDYFDADAVSYLVQSGGVTVFDGGDTLFDSRYREVGRQYRVDAALLNFAHNPPDEIYYLNHAHVVRTAVDVGARLVVPKHYDLWQEFLDDPVPLAPLLSAQGIALRILQAGEALTLRPRPEGEAA